MATEFEINRAKQVLRSLLGNGTKRHNRMHDNAKADIADRLRALEGLCGQCGLLKLEFKHQDGKDVVVMRCDAGASPLALYQKTDIGQKAVCPQHQQK